MKYLGVCVVCSIVQGAVVCEVLNSGICRVRRVLLLKPTPDVMFITCTELDKGRVSDGPDSAETA